MRRKNWLLQYDFGYCIAWVSASRSPIHKKKRQSEKFNFLEIFAVKVKCESIAPTRFEMLKRKSDAKADSSKKTTRSLRSSTKKEAEEADSKGNLAKAKH